MAERSESPTSAGAGGSKRQRGSLVGFIKEHQQQWAEAMESAINEEFERMDNEKTAKIDAIMAERDLLAAKNEELTTRIDNLSAEKAALVNELAVRNEELTTRINDFSVEKAVLVNELAVRNEELAAKNKTSYDLYIFWTNVLDRAKDEKQKLLDEAKASSDRYNNISDNHKKLEEANAELKVICDKRRDAEQYVIEHFQKEREMWKQTVKDRELKIVQLETNVQELGDVFGAMTATMNQCRQTVNRSVGALGNLDIDVVYLDDKFSGTTWVFSFIIQSGEQNVSKDALAFLFAAQVLERCELDVINSNMYVFVKFAHGCTSWWLKTMVEENFDTANYLAIICPSSRAASNAQSDTRKRWTEKKFHSFISKLRAADFIRPAPFAAAAAAAPTAGP
jgi:hypothetical protein